AAADEPWRSSEQPVEMDRLGREVGEASLRSCADWRWASVECDEQRAAAPDDHCRRAAAMFEERRGAAPHLSPAELGMEPFEAERQLISANRLERVVGFD